MTTKPNEKPLTGSEFASGVRALENAMQSRTAQLIRKADDGSITDDERDELVKSLSAVPLGKQAQEPINKSQSVQDPISKGESTDVSRFLHGLVQSVSGGLDVLGGGIEGLSKSQTDFNKALGSTALALVKSVSRQNELLEEETKLLKSVEGKLDQLLGQPARQARGTHPGAKPVDRQIAAPVATPPAGAGVPAEFGHLTKAAIEEAMSNLMEKGEGSILGRDLLAEATHFGQTNNIDSGLLAEIVRRSPSLQKSA